MLGYLGWIPAAFLAGVLLMVLRHHHKPDLRQKVSQMGIFAGRTYAEILETMDEPQTTVQRSDGHTLRTWRDGGYNISLLFNAGDMCLGVERESN